MQIGKRKIGLEKLEKFVPAAGKEYEKFRNYDFGFSYENKISMLSAYLRTRLITEKEVINAVLTQHKMQPAQKFIQEVIWRTYWKGWLEMRPGVWNDYKKLILNSKSTSSSDSLDKALCGETGIECFDHWTKELIETGYLHNHARMWFASIWVFTLKLPWYLGADFFMKHLLDGDVASNTLSWRWVSGIQTVGKSYLASAENIKKYTDGRFFPKSQLALEPFEIADTANKEVCSLDSFPDRVGNEDDCFLVHEEDLSLEFLNNFNEKKLVVIRPESINLERCSLVNDFINSAINDQIERLESSEVLIEVKKINELEQFLLNSDVKTVSLIKPHVGYLKDALSFLDSSEQMKVNYYRRNWDSKLYPYAKKGFFPYKKAVLPKALNEIL